MSTYTQVILEIFCSYLWDDKSNSEQTFCERGLSRPCYRCLEDKCTYIRYTYAPLEFAYSDETGEIFGDNCIAFGGEMEVDDNETNISLKMLWEKICKNKLEEAYKEYMEEKNKFSK